MNMRSRRLFSTAVGVAFAACTMGVFTSSSWAGAFTLGSGTFSDVLCAPACNGGFGNTVSAGLADTFAFQISSGLLFHTASATNSSSLAGQRITDFKIELFAGDPTDGNPDTLLATGTPQSFSNGFQSTGGLEANIGPGIYFLNLTGTVGGTATTYSGSFAFSPVPGPVVGAG